jgi:hypothetical protein
MTTYKLEVKSGSFKSYVRFLNPISQRITFVESRDNATVFHTQQRAEAVANIVRNMKEKPQVKILESN